MKELTSHFISQLINEQHKSNWQNLINDNEGIKIIQEKLTIKHREITGFTTLKAQNIDTSINFSHCVFKEPVVFDSGNGNFNLIRFHECQTEDLIFRANSINEIQLESCVIKNSLILGEECEIKSGLTIRKETQGKSSIINDLFISSSCNIRIYDTDIKELYIQKFTLESNRTWHISRVKLKELNIEQFLNYGEIVFDSITCLKFTNRFIKFSDSVLGNLSLISCNLYEFVFYITNSRIREIFYTNTKFPDEIKNESIVDQEQLLGQQDNYGQLETVAKNSGQHTDAIYWRAMANDSYLKKLKLNLDIHNYQDYINLKVSKCISNYGQSLIRPIVAIFIIGIIFFPFLVVAADQNISFCFDSSCSYLEGFIKHLGSFFEFLLPIHRVDFLKNTSDEMRHPQWYIFLDVMARILVSYPIYQFIRATRKFAGK